MHAKSQWVCPRCVTKKRKAESAGASKTKPKAKASLGKKRKKKGAGSRGDNATKSPAPAAAASKKRKSPSGGSGGATGGTEPETKKVKVEWSVSQEAVLAAAVKKIGAGKWKKMVRDPDYDFEGKPANSLKHKWRILGKRLGK